MTNEKKYKIPLGKIVKEAAKEIKTDVLAPTGHFLEGAFYMNLVPYRMPTFARQQFEPDTTEKKEVYSDGFVKPLNERAEGAGVLFGVVGYFVQLSLYCYACQKGHPEVLAIPVATNLASALYEKGRKVRKMLEDKITGAK